MILITGSSGFVGTNLINFFIKKKIKFIGIDLKKNQYIKNLNFKKINITNLKQTEKLFQRVKPKVVIHLAAISGVGLCQKDIRNAFKTNVNGSFNILYLSKKYNCKKILLASSFASSNFEEQPNYYGYTKRNLDNMALTFKKNFSLNVGVLKFSNIYGPFSLHKNSAIHQIIKSNINKKKFQIHGSGKQSRDFVYINDVIKSILGLLDKKKIPLENYIHSKKFTQLSQVIKIINNISNFKTIVKYVKAPPGYDTRIKNNFNKPNKEIIKNLKKTFNWYRSNYK